MTDDSSPKRYEPHDYWEQLLTDSFDASGTAYAYLAVSFNRALYRTEFDVARRALARRLRWEPPRSALDVGSGTGMWIGFWQRMGVPSITGLDLTEASITRLRERDPETDLIQADIGEPGLVLDRQFDVISAMSVLLHITDSHRFSSAVANLARHLAPGGLLLMIEPVIVNRWWGGEFGPQSNSVARGLSEWERVLAAHDLQLVDLRPVTFLLANPIDCKRQRAMRLWSRYWEAVLRYVGRRERVGAAAGAMLELLDRPLRRILRPGPSAKLLVITRR